MDANIEIVLVDWQSAARSLTAIRYQVFVVEQKVPVELELDELDPVSLHALAHDGSNCVLGTGRLTPTGKIGRMAVDIGYRGCGVGGKLLSALIQAARQRGDDRVCLSAQISALRFYHRYGFIIQSEIFMDAGIPHQDMCLRL